MVKNKLLRASPILVSLLLLFAVVSPVFADGGGHLWFYSQDPDTISGPQPLPNPQDYDPAWSGTNADPWLSEGGIIMGDWESPFSIWLGCAQFESLNTMVVISINDAAYAAISSIMVNGVPITSWSSGIPSALSPHGVFNSAEFYGYAEVNVGNLEEPGPTSIYPYKVEIVVDIDLVPSADLDGAKIHFDAYGYTEEGSIMFSPYSHDSTFMVPEAAPLVLAGISIAGLGLYGWRRKKNK